MSLPRIYTPEQARQKLGIGRTRFYELLRNGQIRAIRNGRNFLIPESSLTEFIEKQLRDTESEADHVEYIGRACTIAHEYFKNVGIEVYPMNTDDYAYLHECGADYVTVFQETYDSDRYAELHLAGHKRIFPYRLNAQERAIRGGMRGMAFAALLGLADFRKDAFAVGNHAYLLQRKYPHAEISFSCPRLRPIINNDKINPKDVHERLLLQVMCAYRIFMPFAGLTISTRERAGFRDNVIGMCATKISAGVSTGNRQPYGGRGCRRFTV